MRIVLNFFNPIGLGIKHVAGMEMVLNSFARIGLCLNDNEIMSSHVPPRHS